MYFGGLLGWIIHHIVGRAIEGAVEPEHVEPTEEDWTWENEDMEGHERESFIAELSDEDLQKYFNALPAIFESGFTETQATVMATKIDRLRVGEVFDFDFNARWNGVSAPLQIVLSRQKAEGVLFEIATRKELAEALETFLQGFKKSR